LALRRLAVGGVEYRHGDIRNTEPTPEVSTCSLYAQRSPQLKQGCMGENATSSIRTSWARSIASTTPAAHDAAVIFLSRSGIYPVTPLRELPLVLGVVQRLVQGRGVRPTALQRSFPSSGAVRFTGQPGALLGANHCRVCGALRAARRRQSLRRS
jgi:hypothetical protein